MRVSFEGIGQWSATFACTDVQEGQVVKISGTGEVGKCADGEAFCGVVNTVGRDGEACGVVRVGMVTVPYTGSAPTLGWSGLAADGNGGVKADSAGAKVLVAAVDESAMNVTFVL